MPSRLRRVWGHGFLAAIAGIEITNIVVFTKLGAVYGVLGFLLTIIFVLPIAYLQQLVIIPRKIYGRSLLDELYLTSQRNYKLYLYTIYLSSILTLIINIIGISIIFSIIIGSKWIYYGLLFIVLIWILDNMWKSKKIDKFFLILSMVLMIYIVLFIFELPILKTISIEGLGEKLSYIDLLALWGAAAAPYSLIIQDLGDEDYTSIYAGALSSIFIGISIAFVAYASMYPLSRFNIVHTLIPFYRFSGYIVPIYALGVFGSVVLASISIVLTLKIIFRRLRAKIMSDTDLIEHLLLALIISTIPLIIFFKVNDLMLYTEALIYGSMMIGFIFSITILSLFMYYLYRSLNDRQPILIFNTIFLGILTMISIILSVNAIIEAFHGL